MPPPVYAPRQAPEYNESVAPVSSSGFTSSFRFMKPGFDDKVDLRSIPYSKTQKRPTVFRPWPCRSFSKPETDFEPYRIDPAGTNHFGWWLTRVPCAWKVGKPTTSFLLHNPFSRARYDSRLTPLSTLHRAISFAVKKGQGKAQEWSDSIRRPFEPDAQTVLEWSGAQSGSATKGAILKAPTEVCLMQGAILLYGGEHAPAGKAPIGWGDRPTCVLALTSGAADRMVELLNQERDGFRGNPADFASRYVEGDPISLDGGKYLVVYPKGGDPRQPQYAAQVAENYDPFSATTGGYGSGERKEEDFGFDCHWSDTHESRNAAFNTPQARQMIRDKWIHWEDMLWFPTFVEQAEIMANIFPASMLVYAFAGEHPEWLNSDVRARAVGAHSAAVPAPPPPSGGYVPPPGQTAAGYAPSPASYDKPPATAAPPAPMNTQQTDPFSMTGVPDAALPRPGAAADPFAAAQAPVPSSPLDKHFTEMMAEFPGNAEGVPTPPPVPTSADFGFGNGSPPVSGTAAAIAAAKANLGK